MRISFTTEALTKLQIPVTPVKTGVQDVLKKIDSRFRGNDVDSFCKRFYLLFATSHLLLATYGF